MRNYLLILLYIIFPACSHTVPVRETAPPPTLYWYPDTDEEADRTGIYYSKEKLIQILQSRKEPEEIERIHNKISEFDQWVGYEARRLGISTVTIAIVNDYNVLYQRAINTSIQRKYPVVSFTKPVVALAILQLAEEGRLSLDDPVNKYLPGRIYYHPSYPSVTIHHLLTHTSGVTEGGSRIAPPGRVFSYSNNGYRMLGRIITVITKEPLYVYLRKRIMNPMQMNHSVADYRTDGAAGMRASTVDLRKFLIMHLNRGSYMGQHIISRVSYAKLFGTPAPRPECRFTEYRGIAWRIWTADSKTLLVNHAALWHGMGGTMQWYPEYNIGWIFMSNPVSHNHPAFRAFYIRIRARLNNLSRDIAQIPYNPNYIRPCFYQTVSW